MSSAPEISRANPASFLFLIDQSGSMEQKLAGQAGGINKMNAAANPPSTRIRARAIAFVISSYPLPVFSLTQSVSIGGFGFTPVDNCRCLQLARRIIL